MALQYSTDIRNNQLDQVESTTGVSAVLKIRTGDQPANCAAADSGTVLATITLPVDWMAAAASGLKAMLGSWTTSSAAGTGIAGHFRIYESTGTTCKVQGKVTLTGAGGEMTLNNTSITATQAVTVTSFTLAAGNA